MQETKYKQSTYLFGFYFLMKPSKSCSSIGHVLKLPIDVADVPPWWPGSSSKIIKVNGYVRHNFI